MCPAISGCVLGYSQAHTLRGLITRANLTCRRAEQNWARELKKDALTTFVVQCSRSGSGLVPAPVIKARLNGLGRVRGLFITHPPTLCCYYISFWGLIQNEVWKWRQLKTRIQGRWNAWDWLGTQTLQGSSVFTTLERPGLFSCCRVLATCCFIYFEINCIHFTNHKIVIGPRGWRETPKLFDYWLWSSRVPQGFIFRLCWFLYGVIQECKICTD